MAILTQRVLILPQAIGILRFCRKLLCISRRALDLSGIRHPKATVHKVLHSKAIVPMHSDQIENTPS